MAVLKLIYRKVPGFLVDIAPRSLKYNQPAGTPVLNSSASTLT